LAEELSEYSRQEQELSNVDEVFINIFRLEEECEIEESRVI
jgi:hypothetical protein